MALSRNKEVEKFNQHARGYREAMAASVAASGEAPEYFAEHKLRCLERLGMRPTMRVLDYGCGTGSLSSVLSRAHVEVDGYDLSAESLRAARDQAPRARFFDKVEELPDSHYDFAVLAGVLHHVPPAERDQVLDVVTRTVRPGGKVCVFEHNPLNPLTRRAVRLCPFDDDAVLLPPGEVRSRLRVLLDGVEQHFVLFFPKQLAVLRSLEPSLHWLPIGAQTLTWGRRGESR